jgi:hypothetical protein
LIPHAKSVAEVAFCIGVFVFRKEPETDGDLRAVGGLENAEWRMPI